MSHPDPVDVIAHVNDRPKENAMTTDTIQRPYRKIAFLEGACPVCNEVHKLTEHHNQPSYINKYGIRQKGFLLIVHGPRGDRCAGSHTKPLPWLEASGLPAWDEMSDLDKGAALLFVWKCHWERSYGYARDNYPATYIDDERLRALDPDEACRHGSNVAGMWKEANERLGAEETQRLYDLALAAAHGKNEV